MRRGGGFKVTKTVTTSKPGRVTTTTTKTVSSPGFSSPGIVRGPTIQTSLPSIQPSVKLSSSGVKVKVKTPVGKIKVKKTYVVRRVHVAPPRRRFCLARALVFTTAAVALTTVSLAEMDRVVIIKGKKGNYRCARDTDAPTCSVHNIRELGHLVELRVQDSMGQTAVLYSDSYCATCGQYFMLRREDINIPIEYQVQHQTTVVQGQPPGPMMSGPPMMAQPSQQVVTVQQPPLPTVRPAWIKDRDAPNCMRCRSEFTVTNRRHHCRNCGKIFCTDCCNKKMRLRHLGFSGKELTCIDCVTFLEQYWHNQRNPQKVVVNTPSNNNVQPMPQQPYGAYPQQEQVPYYPPNNGSVLPNPNQQPLGAPQQYLPEQFNNQVPQQPQSQVFYPTQYSAHAPVAQQQVQQPHPTAQFTQIYSGDPAFDPSRSQQFSAHVPHPASNQTYTPTIIPPHSSSGSSKSADELFEAVKSSIKKANDLFSHYRYTESAEEMEKARTDLNFLDNPPYNLSDKVRAFVHDMRYQIDTLEKKLADAMMTRVADDKVREAKTHGTTAKDMHFHNRYAEALDAIEKARESISLLANPPYCTHPNVFNFLPGFVQQINDIEAKCGESLHGRKVDEKIREAKTLGTTAKDMHFHNRYQESLDAVAKARECIANLQSNYGSFQSVMQFLPEFIKHINDIEAKCGESLYDRKIDEKIREAKTHGTTAKDMHYHNRYQESLDAISKARECVTHLQLNYGNYPTVMQFLPEYLRQIDDIEAKCGESLYGRKIDEKIREAKTFGTTAKDMHFHNRYQESLDAVAKARECVANLQSNYGSYQSVMQFLPEFIKHINDIEVKCGESMMNRVVDDKIREAKTHGTNAKDMVYHNRYQEALTAINKARESIAELSDMPYINFQTVQAFLSEFINQVNGYQSACDAALGTH